MSIKEFKQKGFIPLWLFFGTIGVVALLFFNNPSYISAVKEEIYKSNINGSQVKELSLARGEDVGNAEEPSNSRSGRSGDAVKVIDNRGSNSSEEPRLTSTSDERQVDCTGSDGKRQMMSWKSCEEIKKRSRNDQNFSGGQGIPKGVSLEVKKVEPPLKKADNNNLTSTGAEQPEEDDQDFEKSDFELEISGDKLRINNLESSKSGKLIAEKSKLNLSIKIGDKQQDVTLQSDDNKMSLTSSGQKVLLNFPISYDSITNSLMVKTGQGLKTIRVLPDKAAEIAKNSGISQKINNIELVENERATNKLAFHIKATETGKLFGLVPLNAETDIEVDADQGTILQKKEPTWLKLLSPFLTQ